MKFILVTVIFWGITPVFDKIAAVSSDATVGVFIRSVAVAVFSVIAMTVAGKWGLLASTGTKAVVCLSVSGIIAGGLGVFTYLRGIQETGDAGKVAVLCSTYPLVALAVTAIILQEKLTLWKVLGSVLITTGVICLNF